MKSAVKTVPFWTDIDKVPSRFPWLDDNDSCEVCIIGGGVTGAMTAMRLARSGIDAILVTAHPLGFGGTSLSPSCVRYDSTGTLTSMSEKVGIDCAAQVYSAQKKALNFLEDFSLDSETDFGFSLRDSILYTNDPTEKTSLFREFQLRKNCDFDVEFISGSQIGDIFSFDAEAAIISKGLAAELDPYLLTHAAAVEAVKNGARVYENTRITAISEQSGKCMLTASTRRKITASSVILTIGSQCSDYVGGLGQSRTSAAVVSRPIEYFEGWPGKCVISCLDHPCFTVSSTPDDRLFIFGACSSMLDESGRIKGVVPARSLANKRYELLERTAREMFPRIPLDFEYRFTGSHLSTFAGLPVIDNHPDYDHCCYAVNGGESSVLISATAATVLTGLCRGNGAGQPSLYSLRR